ncbi:MAG: glycosyltransferase family 2 protein [Clostridia bacterium]|jgi:glycosyltransferase involved in cell wall biosynthesis|nr:glycosyltransferase family 2 protein [Clostridia bacterium]
MEDLITVFTPTYNREHTLKKLYQSLQKQTNMTFEWVIVDDGSEDNTEELVQKWILEEKNFPIIYFKKENEGKHTAINKGLDLAKGKMFFIVDSDDYLTEDAIEKIIKDEKTIQNMQDKFAGIAMSKGFTNTELVGTTFKGEYVDATSLERKKYNINGDKAEIFYTEILKQNRFPKFEGERFVTEALVWNRIAKQGYKLRWFQDIIYICEYLGDGLTQNIEKAYRNSPKGFLTYTSELLTIYKWNLVEKIRYISYYEYIFREKYTEKEICEQLQIHLILLKISKLVRRLIKRGQSI